MSIIVGILIFSVIILIHEFGHFYAARKCGIKVEEFAMGMGPKLLSFKPGETVYSLRLFPLGGSCQMKGEEATEGEVDESVSDAFYNKPVWQRIIVILAGVFMNFVLALVVMTSLTLVTGYAMPVVHQILPGSPAAEAGLLPGDRILKADGTSIHISDELSFIVSEKNNQPIDLLIERNGTKMHKSVTPREMADEDGVTAIRIGFKHTMRTSPFEAPVESFQRAGFFDSLRIGVYKTLFDVKMTFVGLTRLITLRVSPDQMSGPIGVVSMVSNVYEQSIQNSVKLAVLNMLRFMAFLSATIGIMNLLPLPALDGGRLIFLIIEGIRRKPVNREIENMVHFVGFALLMILAVFIAYNDIMKLV